MPREPLDDETGEKSDDERPSGYATDSNVKQDGTGPSTLQPDEEESMRRFGWLDPTNEIRGAEHPPDTRSYKSSDKRRFFAPTSRADWQCLEACIDAQIAAYSWDYTDDEGVMTADIDSQENPIHSPVAALANRHGFSPKAMAAACLAIRKDPLLVQRAGLLSVNNVTVSGYDIHGLMHDIIALIDLAIDGGFEQGYDEMQLYTARLLVQYLRNAEARRVHQREGF